MRTLNSADIRLPILKLLTSAQEILNDFWKDMRICSTYHAARTMGPLMDPLRQRNEALLSSWRDGCTVELIPLRDELRELVEDTIVLLSRPPILWGDSYFGGRSLGVLRDCYLLWCVVLAMVECLIVPFRVQSLPS